MRTLGQLTRSWIGAAAVVLSLTGVASAIPLTLSGPISGNTVGPQSTSNPCVIAGTTCQNPAGFGYNNFDATGNVDAYNMYSTTPTGTVADGVQGTPYTVSQILGVTNNNPFVVAIDVNTTTKASETLTLFEVIINGAVAYSYSGSANIGIINNNGNGYADYTLGVIDLSGYLGTATVLFHAVWSGAVDGAESFFIVAVPGPLLGAGVPGLILACGVLVALARRRRQQFA